MSSNKTEHLQLHRWDLADGFHTEELNENFARLDAAAGEKPYVMGTYQGTGGYGAGAPCRLELGFRPSLLMVWRANYCGMENRSSLIISAQEDIVYTDSSNGNVNYCNYFTWTDTGVSWYGGNQTTQLNLKGTKYNYLAFR